MYVIFLSHIVRFNASNGFEIITVSILFRRVKNTILYFHLKPRGSLTATVLTEDETLPEGSADLTSGQEEWHFTFRAGRNLKKGSLLLLKLFLKGISSKMGL